MYIMEENAIIQTTDKVLAKAEIKALDLRTQQTIDMVLYCELDEEDQDVKPILDRGLKQMGYMCCGIENVDTTSVLFDAKEEYLKGKFEEERRS